MEYNRAERSARGLRMGGGDADNSVLLRRTPNAEHQHQHQHLQQRQQQQQHHQQHHQHQQLLQQQQQQHYQQQQMQLLQQQQPQQHYHHHHEGQQYHHHMPQRVERPMATGHVSRSRVRRSTADREQVSIVLPCDPPAAAAAPEPAVAPVATAPEPADPVDAALVEPAVHLVAESASVTDFKDMPEPNQLVRFCFRMGVNALLHPYEMAKILIQLGHEPIAAIPYQLPFVGWRPRFYLPGVHRYAMHIYQLDGFRGLYRGLAPRLVASAFDYLLGDVVLDTIRLTPYVRAKSRFGIQEFLWNLMIDTIRLATSVAITHPFYVIMVRQVAQFVGRETVYEGLWSSLKSLLASEGLVGLYAGVVPLFLCEWAILAGTSAVSHLCHRLVPMTFIQQQYNGVIIQMVVSKLLYPLHVTAACMAATGAPLSACEPPRMPLYNHWVDCLADLQARGGHHRGGLLFWRTVPRIQMAHLLEANVPPTGIN